MHVLAPASLLAQVRAHIAALHRVVAYQQPSTVRRDLLATTAEAKAAAARLSFSMGNYADAIGFYAASERRAMEAGHGDLRAYVLGQTRHLHSSLWHTGPGSRTTLNILDEAMRTAATTSNPHLLLWLAVRRAEEHAAAGDRAACYQDLDAAEHQLGKLAESPRESGFFLHCDKAPEARLAGYIGNCERVLGTSNHGAGLIESAIDQVDHSLTSVRASMMADLASAYARQGDADQSCATIATVLQPVSRAGLVPHVNRLMGVRHELERWSEAPSVKQLDELLCETLGGPHG